MNRKFHFPKNPREHVILWGKSGRSILFSLAIGSMALPLYATDYTWQAATGGDFGSSANWSPSGVPGSSSGAIFNSGSGTVNATTLGASTTVSQLLINSDLTFDFGGKTLTADSGSGSAVAPDLNVTTSSATFSNGTYNAGVAQIGSAGGSTLNVSGSGTSLTVGGGFFQTGIATNSNTDGTLVVSSGAGLTVNTQEFDIGGAADVDNVNAELHITGSGTTASLNSLIMAVGSYFNSSDNNKGTLRISDGAVVTGSSTLYVGQSDRAGSSGKVVVEGGATFNATGGIQVGRTDDTGTSATVIVQTAGSYKLNSASVQTYANSTVYVGGSSLLEAGVIQNNSNNGFGGSSATVMGSGTIRSTSATFNQYGILRPGDNPSASGIGTLLIGDITAPTNMTLDSISMAYFELNGTDTAQFDQVLVTGSISGTAGNGGGLVLNFGFAPSPGDTFTIMSATGGWSDITAGGFNVTWLGQVTGGTINIVGNDLVVSSVTIPEPSTYLLMLTGGAFYLMLRRRSKIA